MASAMYTNLAPLIRTASVPITQYLVATVSRGEIDLLQIQRDLEAESVEWSNKKIGRVTQAIKTLLYRYNSATAETREGFKQDLAAKCIFTKQSQLVIDALIDTAAGLLVSEAIKVLKLQELVDFQLMLRHDFSSMECKNLNETRAQLLFKIRGSDGVIETRRLEISLEELKQVKKELVRIEETLS